MVRAWTSTCKLTHTDAKASGNASRQAEQAEDGGERGVAPGMGNYMQTNYNNTFQQSHTNTSHKQQEQTATTNTDDHPRHPRPPARPHPTSSDSGSPSFIECVVA